MVSVVKNMLQTNSHVLENVIQVLENRVRITKCKNIFSKGYIGN